MTTAVMRNLYRGADSPHAAAIARYVLAARMRLVQQDMASGQVDFGALP